MLTSFAAFTVGSKLLLVWQRHKCALWDCCCDMWEWDVRMPPNNSWCLRHCDNVEWSEGAHLFLQSAVLLTFLSAHFCAVRTIHDDLFLHNQLKGIWKGTAHSQQRLAASAVHDDLWMCSLQESATWKNWGLFLTEQIHGDGFEQQATRACKCGALARQDSTACTHTRDFLNKSHAINKMSEAQTTNQSKQEHGNGKESLSCQRPGNWHLEQMERNSCHQLLWQMFPSSRTPMTWSMTSFPNTRNQRRTLLIKCKKDALETHATKKSATATGKKPRNLSPDFPSLPVIHHVHGGKAPSPPPPPTMTSALQNAARASHHQAFEQSDSDQQTLAGCDCKNSEDLIKKDRPLQPLSLERKMQSVQHKITTVTQKADGNNNDNYKPVPMLPWPSIVSNCFFIHLRATEAPQKQLGCALMNDATKAAGLFKKSPNKATNSLLLTQRLVSLG